MLSVTCSYHEEGEPFDAPLLLRQAWAEFPELRYTSEQEFRHRVRASIRELDRWELLVLAEGVPVAIAVLALDDDLHVGPCVTVQWQYILPDYRGLGITKTFMRVARNVTRQLGLTVLAFSHRLGDGQYKISYRRVYVQKGQEVHQESDKGTGEG